MYNCNILTWNKVIILSVNLLFKQYGMELFLKQIRIFLTTYYMGAHPSKLRLPLRLKVIFLMDALIQIFGKVFCTIMKLLSGFCTVQGSYEYFAFICVKRIYMQTDGDLFFCCLLGLMGPESDPRSWLQLCSR